MAKSFRITVKFDVTTNEDADADWLHDGFRDYLDTVELEGSYDETIYDENGEETDDTKSINFSTDNIYSVSVQELED